MKTTNLNIMNTTLLHLSIACLLNLQFMLPLRAQVVFIPDEEFQAAIREALESPSGDITSAQMQSLTRLEAGGLILETLSPRFFIEDFRGLEHATQLEYLDLSFNRLTEATLPGGLTKLSELNLTANQLKQVTLPDGLANLTDIDLSNNPLDTLTLPKGINRLAWLDLTGNGTRQLNIPLGFDLNQLRLDGFDKSDVTFYVPTKIERLNDFLEISWTSGTLQSTDDLNGTWTTETSQSPFVVPTHEAQRFFRVVP